MDNNKKGRTANRAALTSKPKSKHTTWRSAGEIVADIAHSIPPAIEATAIAQADGVVLTDDPEQRVRAVTGYWMGRIWHAELTPELLLQFEALHARHPEWRDS